MDDDGPMFGLFGDEGEDEHKEEESPEKAEEAQKPAEPQKIKHDGCPLDDPRGARVRVMYDGELSPAKIKSYEPGSDTYTIIWASTGSLQYRTNPSDINWDHYEDVVEEKKAEDRKEEVDELWLAARRGSLKSVKRFIEEESVQFNETGKSQNRTPFYHAVFCGHLAVAEYLIEKGAWDSDDTAFIVANTAMRELLIRTGAGGKPRQKAKSVEARAKAAADPQVKAELRRKSVTKAASQHLHPLEGQVSRTELIALQQLEERLLAVEAAMKTQERRQSAAVKKESSQKVAPNETEGKPEQSTARRGTTDAKSSAKISDDNSKSITKQTSVNKSAIVVAPKRKPNLLFRVLTFIPRKLFGAKKKTQKST